MNDSRHESSIMNEREELESDIEIAKHNVWVAKTHVQDREEELATLRWKLKQLDEQQKVNPVK